MPKALQDADSSMPVDAGRPFPSEHSCRLKEPSAFQDGSFRRTNRKHGGKSYSIIMGRLKGQTALTEQAYRYPKDSWTEAQARSHCSTHGGKLFEAASGTKAADLPEGQSHIELPMFHRGARFAPSTIDDESRTVELTWTTGAVVRRRGFFSGDWDEELVLDDGAVRLERLNNSANLLDSHSASRLASVIGVVERAWLQGSGKSREGRALVRFSGRDEVAPIWNDVRDGIIRNVSVGYRHHEVVKIERKDNVPLVRLTDWEPLELSLVAVPADAKAQVRSGDDDDSRLFPCIVRGVTTMAKTTSAATSTEEVAEAEIPSNEDHGDVNERSEDTEGQDDETPVKGKKAARGQGKVQKILDEVDEERERKQRTANGNGAQKPVPPSQPGVSEDEVAKRVADGIKAEGERRDRIEQMCRVLKIEADVGQRLIKEGISADDAWRELLAEADRRDHARSIVTEPRTRVNAGEQDEETIRYRSIASSLLHRYNPNVFKLEFEGNRYVGFSLVELGRHCLESAGIRTVGMQKSELAERCLQQGYGVRSGSGYHTTSDFSSVLADVANKTLRQAYAEAPRTFLPFTRRATAPDFKTINRTQIGEMPTLTVVGEHGEYKRVTMSDAKEAYSLATYGAVFAITRKVIINDDLDAFTRMPQKFGASAARTESDIVWGVITTNAAMGDGTALFHANHGNLKASGSGAPAVTTVGAGRAAMRIQTGLDGALINVAPAYLIVPAALETVAEQFLTAVTYVGTATPLAMTPERLRSSLTLIVEPRLDTNSTTAWYLAASPSEIDTIEYAYLEGSDGVAITTRNGFDIDGVEVKASLDFAAKAIDWRGMYKDVGTA